MAKGSLAHVAGISDTHSDLFLNPFGRSGRSSLVELEFAVINVKVVFLEQRSGLLEAPVNIGLHGF